jgi:hypothetical protein
MPETPEWRETCNTSSGKPQEPSKFGTGTKEVASKIGKEKDYGGAKFRFNGERSAKARGR